MTTNSLSILLILVSFCSSAKSLSWIGPNNAGGWYYIGDPLVINCSLTQADVNVSLWQQPKSGSLIQRTPDQHLRQNNQIYKIDSLVKEDNGDYECQAANITSSYMHIVVISADGIPKPVPKISYDRSNVKYGKKLEVKCSAIGIVILTWYKKSLNGMMTELHSGDSKIGKMLHGGKKTTTRILTVEKFNISDSGTYRCRLMRPLVQWSAYKDVNITLDFLKPDFKIFPSANVTTREGKDEDFWEYEVVGSPQPSVTWYIVRDDNKEERLAECGEGGDCNILIADYLMLDIDEYYFTIKRPSFPKDNVKFKCVAKNLLGIATKEFSVTVEARPKIVKGRNDMDVVHAYRNSPETKVICKVKTANPRNQTYIWQIEQYSKCSGSDCKPKNKKWITLATSKSYGIASNSQNSTLTLKYYKQPVFIRCTVNNGIGKDQHIWRLIMLAKERKPLNAWKKTVETDEGETVALSCMADLSVFSIVIWKRGNVTLRQNSRLNISSNTAINGSVYHTLLIRRANVTDGGVYKCIGIYNGQKNITLGISLTVQELKKPFVLLRRHVTKEPFSFIISCDVTGHPKPKIIWSKDDKLLSNLPLLANKKACSKSISGIYRMSKEGKDDNVLIICKTNYKKHSGLFTCNASNYLGSHSAEAYIDVPAAPTIDSLTKSSYAVEIGERFSLSCLSSGYPTPNVLWEKQDIVGKGFKPLENIQGKNLSFAVVNKENLGVYRCVAKNKFKTETKNIKLEEAPAVSAQVAFPDNSKKYAVVIGCVSFAVLAIVIIVAVILYKRKKIYGGFYILTLPPLPDYIKKLDPGTPLTEQTNKLPYDPEWEFPRNRLKFYRELGAGAFGKVFLAEGMGIVAFDPRGSTKRKTSRRRFGGSARRNHYVNSNKMAKVAVKTLKEDSGETEYKDLLSELKILIHVGEHKNIVNLLGACTKGRESDLWVIIEFCSNGNLLQFLRSRRDIYETEWKGVSKDPNSQLTMTDLVIAAYQVARGMEFLASRMCIHRDLATRNILVTDNYVIKIADFGLARDIGQDSQYVKTSTGLLPIKWMAIEAIIERLFTEKSDIWSFGIVLWELFTLGGTPYPGISPNEVSEFLALGNRMDPPHACPEEIVSLMMTLWHDDRDVRPTFKELVEILDKIIEVHTSSEGGCGYLEVQGDEVMNEYLRPSEVKSPQMDPFQCNSPLPPIPSPGVNERDSLILRDQNNQRKRFQFDKSQKNKVARQDSELEKVQNDARPENEKNHDVERIAEHDIDGYIDTSLTGKENGRIERDMDKDRDSSGTQLLDNYAYWKKSAV